MVEEQLILRLIQSHKVLEYFDYSKAVDWAIDLINQGKETENILILASFSEPFDRYEISPYVSSVLSEFGLEELDYKNAVIAKTHFHLTEILNDKSIRGNLQSLYQLCLDNGYKFELTDFYLLYHAWDELEEVGVNFYFEGANLGNIEDVLKNEARKWVDEYTNRDRINSNKGKNTTQSTQEQAGRQ